MQSRKHAVHNACRQSRHACHNGAVNHHGEPVCTETVKRLLMVIYIGEQSKLKIHSRRRAQGLDDERGNDNRVIAGEEQPDHAAEHGQDGTAQNGFRLTDLIGQRDSNQHAQRCRDRTGNGKRPLQLAAVGDSIIAAGIRKHGLTEIELGHIFDHTAHLKTEKERQALIQKCRNAINEIIAENDGKTVYVFSDSKTFLDAIEDLPVNVLSHDNLGHTGVKQEQQTTLKTFLDLYTMSQSEKIYRVRANELYNLSCFALLASRMNNVPFIDKDI